MMSSKMPACPLTPEEIVTAWNAVAEDHGDLAAALIQFAEGLFVTAGEKNNAQTIVQKKR